MLADTGTHAKTLDYLFSQQLSSQNMSVKCLTYCMDDSLPLFHINFGCKPVSFHNQSRFPGGYVDRQVRGGKQVKSAAHAPRLHNRTVFPKRVLNILHRDALNPRPDCQSGIGQDLGLHPAEIRNDFLNLPLSSSFGKVMAEQSPRVDLSSRQVHAA